MTENRIPVSPERLEFVIARLLIATASLRAPVVWCFAFAIMLNALVLIVPSWSHSVWIVPVIGGCGLIWFTIVRSVIFSSMLGSVSWGDLLVGLGFLTPTRVNLGTKLGLMLFCTPLVLAMVPGRIGAVTTALLVLAVVMFLHKGKAGLTLAGGILIGVSVILLVLLFAGARSVSIACGVIALFGLVVLAFSASNSSSFMKSFFRVELVCSLAAILLALPLSVLGGMQNIIVLTLIVGGFVVPAGSLLAAYLLRVAAISGCRQSTVTMRKSLESVGDLARCEDQVRESDGFYRVCEPNYSHARSVSVGETGYIAWPEEDDAVFPSREGELCLARAITSSSNPLLTGEDLIGIGFRKLFEDIATSIASMVGDTSLQDFVSRINKPWHLRVFRGNGKHEYFKMPWESGEVLAVPCNFTCNFVYPTGSGIIDNDGLPCEVRSLRVQLTLQKELLADFDSTVSPTVKANSGTANRLSSRLTGTANRLSSHLIWRAPLIIPTVYEGMLRSLVAELKKLKTLGTVDQMQLQKNLSATSDECLGPKLRELVELTITSVDVVQSAVSEADRDVDRQYLEFMATVSGKKTEFVRQLINILKQRLYNLESLIAKTKILESQNRIIDAINLGQEKIQTAFDPSQVEGTQAAIDVIVADINSLKDEFIIQCGQLITAFNNIENSFKSKS